MYFPNILYRKTSTSYMATLYDENEPSLVSFIPVPVPDVPLLKNKKCDFGPGISVTYCTRDRLQLYTDMIVKDCVPHTTGKVSIDKVLSLPRK